MPFSSPYLVGVSAALFPSLGAFSFSVSTLPCKLAHASAPVSVIAQASYVYRIYVLSHSRWLAGIVVLVRSCLIRKVVQNVTFAVAVIDDSVCHGDSDGGFLHSDAFDENCGSYASGHVPSHVGEFLAFVYAGDLCAVLGMVRHVGSLRYNHRHDDGPPGMPWIFFLHCV